MQNIINAVDKHRRLILDAERWIWAHPETGYKEFETSKYMEDAFERLGYNITRAEGITGFYTALDTGRPGPEILILGELDSIICPGHPECNKETGAVHSCGHNAQAAALLGIAAALKEPHMLDALCGRIRLCAVPAEELLEINYRTELKKQGKIKPLYGINGGPIVGGALFPHDMSAEYSELVGYAERLGVVNAFVQERDSAREDYIPPFRTDT